MCPSPQNAPPSLRFGARAIPSAMDGGGEDDVGVAALLSWARAAGASLSKTRQRGRALVLCHDVAAGEVRAAAALTHRGHI